MRAREGNREKKGKKEREKERVVLREEKYLRRRLSRELLLTRAAGVSLRDEKFRDTLSFRVLSEALAL